MATHKKKRVQDKGQIAAREGQIKTNASAERSEPRRLRVAHDKVGDTRLDYALFPIGFRYNEDLQSLRRGDIVVFLDGSEHYVWSASRLSLKSAIVEYLCWMRYGFGIARAIEIWQERLRLRKEDIRIMSEEECLIVFFEREEVRYEQKKK